MTPEQRARLEGMLQWFDVAQDHAALAAALAHIDALEARVGRLVENEQALVNRVLAHKDAKEQAERTAAARLAALKEARSLVAAIPTREEWLGGQRTRCAAQLFAVLAHLDAALAPTKEEA